MVNLPYAIGIIIGNLLGASVGALVGALILQYVTRLVLKFKPSYGMAYKATFFAYALSLVTGFVLGFIVGIMGQEVSWLYLIGFGIIGLVFGIFIYGRILAHPINGPIGFKKALIIYVVLGFILAVIALPIFVIYYFSSPSSSALDKAIQSNTTIPNNASSRKSQSYQGQQTLAPAAQPAPATPIAQPESPPAPVTAAPAQQKPIGLEDVEQYRGQLQAEGRSRFVRSPSASKRVRPAPDATVVAVQRRLNELGYRAGPADGILGGKTQAAIQAFQRDNAIAEDGVASASLLRHIEALEQPSGKYNMRPTLVTLVDPRSSQPPGPPNSFTVGMEWYCNSGYKKVRNQCESINAPPNSITNGPEWYCINGYKQIGNKCVSFYP